MHIAIIGAGVAGAVIARLLNEVGCASTIYEQAPQLARVGAGINLAPNSTRVFQHLGLESEMFRHGLEHEEKLNRDFDTGRLTYRVDTKGLARLYGAPFLTIHRGDLQTVLLGGLAPDQLRLGKALERLEPRGPVTRLHFADGSSADADIVIGADGVNSRTRHMLVGEEPAPYSGDVAYRAIYPRARLPGVELPDCTKWWADDGRYMLVYFISGARDQIYFVGGGPEREWGSDSYAPMAVPVSRVKDAFAGFHPEVQRVIDQADAVSRWAIREREPESVWSRGGVVLVGDACHPMTPYMGQGAGMAVEDAAILVRCLLHAGLDKPQDAFRLYELNRQARTARVQMESKARTWMRYTMDHEWLFGPDVLTDPLVEEPTDVPA
ncbi:MAG: FAD-dependent monooxygenase [Lautropia sp.]